MSAMTKVQQLLRIKNEYRAAHSNAPASTRTMLDWAIDTGRYRLDLSKARARAADELADAMRSEKTRDARGREIHVNVAFETEQGWLWDQRDTIGRAHVELHATRGRRMVVGEIKAQVLTVIDWNENHPDEAPIQYSLNFAADLLDDGITLPSSIELEQLLGQRSYDLADSAPPREQPRPSSRPSGRASQLRGSFPSGRTGEDS